jgi:hypothetical protein
MRDRERLVEIRAVYLRGRNEQGPWNRGHRREHARIADTGRAGGRDEALRTGVLEREADLLTNWRR